MLALSAASPIFRGILSDVDTRWAVIGNSVDCRTKQEKGNFTQRLAKNQLFQNSETRIIYFRNNKTRLNFVKILFRNKTVMQVFLCFMANLCSYLRK